MSQVVESETEDLEALFDQIADQRREEILAQPQPAPAAPAQEQPAAGANDPYDVFQRIGSLTRNLHDALRELGYDRQVERAVGALPDARSRLSYIANLTGQAAEKALAKSEAGSAIQEKIGAEAQVLAERWDALMAGTLSVSEFRESALATHAFLNQLPGRAAEANSLFTDIMLAQDFHDLTGQVIKKVVDVAQNLETQLVKLLIDASPPERRVEVGEEWLNGPVIDAAGRTDVVTNQAQVDDLLESLGF